MSMSSSLIVVLCVAVFLLSPVSAIFVTDCQQLEISGLNLTMGPDLGDPNVLSTVFALYLNPVGQQQQLIAYAASTNFFVNQVTLSYPITNGNLQVDAFPTPDSTTGAFPSASASLNGIFAQFYPPGSNTPQGIVFQTSNQALNPTAFRFYGTFLGNGVTAAQNFLLINVTSNPLVVGYNTCTFFYAFNITNPAFVNTTVRGDPQFVGLRGQNYQVHGIDGAVYNLISDESVQLNSRFSFLTGPRPCPVMPSTGKKSVACWSHPGSYLGEMGLKTNGGSRLKVISGPSETGFTSVTLNNQAIKIGASASLVFADGSHGHIIYNSTHEITILAGAFDIEIENNDEFINLRSIRASTAMVSKLQTHGLLGQTWRNKRYSGKVKEIEGEVDDYLVDSVEADQEDGDADLFGDNFIFNRFTASS